jgi:hypothetical protein
LQDLPLVVGVRVLLDVLEAGVGGGFGELVLVVLRVFQQSAFSAVFLGDVFFPTDGKVRLGFGLLVLVVEDELGLGGLLPAVPGDEVAVVLHGLFPVVHEVLIDVVGVEPRSFLEGGEQVFGDGLDEGLGAAILGDALDLGSDGFFPAREELGGGLVEGSELRVGKDGGFDVGAGQLVIAAMLGFLE